MKNGYSVLDVDRLDRRIRDRLVREGTISQAMVEAAKDLLPDLKDKTIAIDEPQPAIGRRI